MNMTMSSILGNFLNFGCLDTDVSSLADIPTISAYHNILMLNLFILRLFLFVSIVLLSVLFVHISSLGILGSGLKRYCKTDSVLEYLSVLFIFICIILYVKHILSVFLLYSNAEVPTVLIDFVNENTNQNQDVVRWWPSGTPQSWGIIASAVGVYRMIPGSPRVKAIAALGSLGVSVPTVVWAHAVENPNGFNRLMYSMVEYQRSGQWPSNVPEEVNTDQLSNSVIAGILRETSNNAGSSSSNAGGSSSTGSSLSSDTSLFDSISDFLLNFVFSFFRPVYVEGYLDDLIGQQMFIYFLLLFIVIGLIILLTLYMFINILLHNKEFILKRFSNRLVRFYIKYQYFLAKISIILLPMLIMVGLLELFVGLYYLITHPIDWSSLPIDLHTYVQRH